MPPSTGALAGNICTCAETHVWAARKAGACLRVGCDDPIRVYHNGGLVLRDDDRRTPDPFRTFLVPAAMLEGLNTIRVVVGNTPNSNWYWNGFSLVIASELRENDFLYMA